MKKPDWYYKPMVVSKLSLIQKEVNNFLPDLLSTHQEIEFYYIKRDQNESHYLS